MKKVFLFLMILGTVVTAAQADILTDFQPKSSTTEAAVNTSWGTDSRWWKAATPEQVEQMIAAGADVNKEYTFFQTPLMMSLKNKNFAVAETLIKHGADVNAKVQGYTLLMLVGDDSEVFNFLSDHGAKTTEDMPTLMVRAAEEDDTAIIERLIKDGADVNVGVMGVTPLIAAAKEEKLAAIETLISHGADINATGFAGMNALMYAATSNKDTAVIETLIKHGADVNALSSSGETALLLAALKNNKNPKDIINALIKAGAKTDVKAKLSGITPLQAAIQNSNLDALEALLENGLDPNGVRSSDLDAVRAMPEMKAFANQPELKKIIEAKLTKGAVTPLMMAANQDENAKEMVELLIKYGADIHAKDGDGRTALDYAKKAGNNDLYPLLK